MKSLYVVMRNKRWPGYGECAKCGGNWGWKEYTTHTTRLNNDGTVREGIFLFCEHCDRTVTLQERWEALDAWKADCIRQIGTYYKTDSPIKVLSAVDNILRTEYLEFPRKQFKGGRHEAA